MVWLDADSQSHDKAGGQARPRPLEEMERRSPPQPCRDHDGMLQEIGRVRDGSGL